MAQHSIPQNIIDICEYLSTSKWSLSHLTNDGRINAALNENEVIKQISQVFKIEVPRSRAWYDFAIETEGGEFYPVNIKITDTTHTDNLNCKLGIYYALTGLKPSFQNEIGWLPYFAKLKENFGKDKSRDYYFFIVNKRNLSDIFCVTLKGLQQIQANGNNLPFQSCWDRNRVIQPRTFEQAAQLILGKLGDSIRLRSEIYFNFKKFFPEYA